MKRVLFLTFLLIFALNGICFAAKSSSRPVSRPSTSTTPAAPASGYKPSVPASSYSDKAPAVKPPAVSQPAQQSTGSGWMRNVGMIAGGMMLGGMLSNLLGHGSSGMLADIMGILIMLLPIIAIFMIGRFLWLRHKSRQEQETITRY